MNAAGTMAAILASVVIAGCLASKPISDHNPAPTDKWTLVDDPKVPAHEMLLTNCQVAQPFRNYPAGLAPGERPDGWGPDSPVRTRAVSIHAYKCERIAIADYERGSIHILMDLHGNAAIPPDCEEGANELTSFRILRQVLLDDPEIGAYLQSTYGIPVLVASFNVADRDAGAEAGTYHDWSWSLDGGTPSVVTMFEPALTSPWTDRERLFWQVGNGLGALQIELEGDAPSPYFEPPANGTIQPPVLLGSDTEGHFVGNGVWLETVNAHGAFTRYSDLGCKEPLP